MMRKLVVLIFIVILSCGSLLCCRAYCDDTWSFVVMGDTRGDDTAANITGVSTYLNAEASKIALLNPKAMFFSGDMINGDDLANSPDPNNPRIPYTTQFANWKAAMAPLYPPSG